MCACRNGGGVWGGRRGGGEEAGLVPLFPLEDEARTVAAAAAPMPATAIPMVAIPIHAVLTRALRPSFGDVK